jgi:hypothetical protein
LTQHDIDVDVNVGGDSNASLVVASRRTLLVASGVRVITGVSVTGSTSVQADNGERGGVSERSILSLAFTPSEHALNTRIRVKIGMNNQDLRNNRPIKSKHSSRMYFHRRSA